MKYLEILKASFLWDRELNKTFFIEFLFIISIVLFSVAWFTIMNQSSGVLDGVLSNTPDAQLPSVLHDAASYFVLFFAGTFLLVLLYLISYTLSRALVWSSFLNKKLNFRIYGKFLLTNIFWVIMWTPLLIFFFLPLYFSAQAYPQIPEKVYISAFLINLALWLMMSYFTLFLYSSFFFHHKIYKAITDSFKMGFLRLKIMIIPLLISFSVIVLVWALNYLIKLMGMNKMFGDYYWVPASLISLYVFMVLRRYLVHFTEC